MDFDVNDFPTNLDPFYLDIPYEHGTEPEELKPYTSGQFFINHVSQFSGPTKLYFCTFSDAREIHFVRWDGARLSKANMEFSDKTEELGWDEDAENKAWREALEGYLDDVFLPDDDQYEVIYERS